MWYAPSIVLKEHASSTALSIDFRRTHLIVVLPQALYFKSTRGLVLALGLWLSSALVTSSPEVDSSYCMQSTC